MRVSSKAMGSIGGGSTPGLTKRWPGFGDGFSFEESLKKDLQSGMQGLQRCIKSGAKCTFGRQCSLSISNATAKLHMIRHLHRSRAEPTFVEYLRRKRRVVFLRIIS